MEEEFTKVELDELRQVAKVRKDRRERYEAITEALKAWAKILIPIGVILLIFWWGNKS